VSIPGSPSSTLLLWSDAGAYINGADLTGGLSRGEAPAETSQGWRKIQMTKSIAVVLLVALAGCAQNTAQPVAAVPDNSTAVSGFEPYCGPIWSVSSQGYVYIPCAPGSGYARVPQIPR
jgi:hypothetical protein